MGGLRKRDKPEKDEQGAERVPQGLLSFNSYQTLTAAIVQADHVCMHLRYTRWAFSIQAEL